MLYVHYLVWWKFVAFDLCRSHWILRVVECFEVSNNIVATFLDNFKSHIQIFILFSKINFDKIKLKVSKNTMFKWTYGNTPGYRINFVLSRV